MFDSLPNPNEYIDASNSPTLGASGLNCRFHMLPVRNEAASKAAGRPIFEEHEFIEISVPGDRTLKSDEPVTEEHKRRFPQAYSAWKLRGEQAVEGTPLEQWPQATRADVEELRFFGVKSVEQLAGLSDANARNVGKVMDLRQKAQDWLAAAKASAPTSQLRARNEQLSNELETLKAIVREQGDRIAALTGKPVADPVAVVEAPPAPKRRGRPPKVRPVEA